MAGYVALGAVFGFAALMTGFAVYAYFGHYWHRLRHVRRGHEYVHMGCWAGQRHWRCECGQWFSTWRGEL